MATETKEQTRHWLLWDGACGFCGQAAAWVERRDTKGLFQIVPYQDAPRPPMNPELERACERAVHVVTHDGRTLSAGRAVLFILGELRWRRTAALLRLPPLVWFVEVSYRLVAAHRPFFSRFFFR